MPNQHIPQWSPEKDDMIRALWGRVSIAEIGRRSGLGPQRVADRGHSFGFQTVPFRDTLSPSPEEWLSIATQKAQEAGIRPALVIRGHTSAIATRARWEAWRAILEANPNYSVAGVARTSGFDHTSILHGLKRLRGATAKSLRQPSYRASYRKPVDNSPQPSR